MALDSRMQAAVALNRFGFMPKTGVPSDPRAVQRNSSLHARIESHGSSTPFSRAAVRPLRYPISSTIDHERRMSGRLKISHVAKRSFLASQNVVYRTLSLRPSRLQSRHSADVRLGHKRTSWHVQPISALRPIADIRIASDNLKFNHRSAVSMNGD